MNPGTLVETAGKLQWGLGFLAEEGMTRRLAVTRTCWLQWGLGFLAEEGRLFVTDRT